MLFQLMMKWPKSLICFFCFLLGPAAWATDESLTARVFELQVVAGNSDSPPIEFCAATLIKPASTQTPRLLTAFHCLRNEARYFIYDRGLSPIWQSDKNSLLPAGPVLEARVLRGKSEFDLAELSTTDDFLESYQSNLKEFTPVTLYRNHNLPLAAVGIHENQLQTRYSREMIWPTYGYTVNSSIDQDFYIFEDLYIERNFSGGAVFDGYKNFIGLISQYEPSKSTIVVPSAHIGDFLLRQPPTIDAIEAQDGASCPSTFSNAFNHSGKNTGIDGGRSCESQDQLQMRYGRLAAHSLRDFIHPNEGAPNPRNAKELILAIDGMSVDGNEALSRIGSAKSLVTRDVGLNQYPAKEIRQGIIARLAGEFMSGLNSRMNLHKTLDGATPLVESHYLNMGLAISSGDRAEDEIHFFWPSLHGRGSFKIEMDNDYKSIHLRGQIEFGADRIPSIKLRCDNNNYKRLVCVSDAISLSVHLENIGQNLANEKMRFKMAIKNPSTGEIFVFVGDLNRAR